MVGQTSYARFRTLSRLSTQAWAVFAAAIPCIGALQTVGHGAMLRTRGYTVVSESIAPTAGLIDDCADLCHSTLERRLADVEAAGCDPIEQMYRFDSICHRQRKRWDLVIPRESTISWAALMDATMETAVPIIREAQGQCADVVPLMCGAVVSRPGARVQRFHVDAAHAHFEAAQVDPGVRMYSVFVPLVDIWEDGDGTMFWPTPVLSESSRALAKHILDAPDSTLVASDLDAPATPAGGLVVFDYRTIHRGLANAEVGGRERPVAYVTCATGGATDEHNFPATAVGDISRERAQALPFWNRGSTAQDRLEYYTEIEGNDPFGVPVLMGGHAALRRPRCATARRVAPLRMLSSVASGVDERSPKEEYEEERQTACEMHAKALKYSDATYHRHEAQTAHPSADSGADSDAESPSWDCFSFPGEGSHLGADARPPGGFAADELARVSRGPFLSAVDCAAIIAEAEAENAWEASTRVAHYARQAGCLTPLSLLPKSLAMLSPFLSSSLFPAIQSAFPSGCGGASLRVSDARLVKYNSSASQTQLGMHRDGPLVTATIALNHPDEYEGGGTRIEALVGGSDSGALRVGRGHVILHPGAVRHGGHPITRGLRYVLVFFIFDANTVDHDRYCVLQANGFLSKALSIQSKSQYRDDILRRAVSTFRAAISLGASTEIAQAGLGQALLELGRSSGGAADMASAVEALLEAVARAPTNAHSLSTLSTALQLSGRMAEALEFASAAAAADPQSLAAHNNHGLLLALLGRHADAIQEGYIVGLRLDPQDAELLCNIAVSTAELGQYKSAASIFAAALASDPAHTRAKENLEALRPLLSD